MPIGANLRSRYGILKSHLFQLNLFNTGTPNQDVIRNERRSTRLYLVMLIISIVILVIYYSIISYTQTIVIQSPKFIEYSDLIQQRALLCPCSTIAIKYEKFIQIEPEYHELCQSNFVSNEWTNHLFSLYEQSWNKSIPSDFRRTGVFQFQTIRSLCQLAKDTINGSLQSFRYTDFIHSQLMSEEVFQDQINSFIKDFIEVTPKTFMRTLRFVQDTTAQSLFMTGASITSVRPITQYRFPIEYGTVPYPGINYTFTDGFTCVCSTSTATSCMGLSTFENDIVPGFQTGCYMLSALMNSTLEAFYNQTFVNILSNSSEHFRKLNSSNSNWKVERLLSQMFVNFWLNSTSYEKYFQSCAPESCQYTKIQHYNFWAIILLLIGLFGGLVSVLRIITPILIVYIWPFVWKIISRRRARATQIGTVENIPVTSMSTRIKILFQLIKRKFIELNLFKSIPPSQDETVLQRERLQTRIYLVLLLTGLFILTVFTSIKPYTVTVTIKSPSLTNFTQLYDQYPLTLDCPCSQPTLEYNKFITYIKPQYHPICLSEFITQRWINLHFIKSPADVFFTNDIRYQSQIHFQLLSTLCRIANQTIEENLQSFYQTKLLTNQVLDLSSFQTQVNLIFDQFKRTVPESYQRTLQLIQVNSEINQFIVSPNSVFSLTTYANGSQYLIFESKSSNEFYASLCSDDLLCKCINVSVTECILMTIIHRDEKPIKIPGMFQATFPLQSILISTLECFYNDACLSQITRLIDPIKSPTNFSTLQLSFNDTPYDHIDILANKLFIQSWNNHSSYELYFNQCYPLTCQYTYESRFNIIYIFTTIIGLLGGLNVALQLFVRPIVKLMPRIWKYMICRKRNNIIPIVEAASIRPTFCDRLRVLIASIKKRMAELNLFPTISLSQDEKILSRCRRITRIYLILLITSIFIVAVYTFLTQKTITDIVKSPSIKTYSKLFNKYPLTLQCPCHHVAVKYEKFITQIEPRYHPVCSSIFVSSNWFDVLYDTTVDPFCGEPLDINDFRLWAKEKFETASKMCSLSEKILNSSLPIWLQTDFITARLISFTEFNFQIETLIKEFKRKTANLFIQQFKLIQTVNHANQLGTKWSSNWQFILNPVHSTHPYSNIYSINVLDQNIAETMLQVLALPKVYDEYNCSCALQSNCSKLSSFPFRTSNQSLRQTLPGFRVGCLPLDAVFQSTFSCLYNETCLDLMRASIYYYKPIPVKTLTDSSLSSQNITIETYLSQLFVTKWFENASFDHYFNECAPKSCQYSYTSKFNQVYFVTIIIALFGGLTKGLHFLIYCVSIVVMKLYDRRKKNQVVPHSQQLNIDVLDSDDKTLEVTPISTITTVTINPIREQIKPPTNHKYRAIMICLVLFVIVVIILVSMLWLRNQDTTHVSRTTSITTMIMSITMAESTTTSTNICYMTFLLYKAVNYPIGLGAKSLIVADLNKDSILDLAVANHNDHTISVLLGNGNGTFQMQQIYSTGNETYPRGITTGDFNNDTFFDLAVTLSTMDQIAIFFSITSNGSFIPVSHRFSEFFDYLNTLSSIEAGDLNDDGFTDLLIAGDAGEWKMPISLYALLNVGDGLRYNYIGLGTPSNIDSIVIGDFDNDGRQNDISVCDLDKKAVVVFSSIDYSESEKYAGHPVHYCIHAKSQSLIRGKFNDDEFDDLALISPEWDALQVLLAYGDGAFIQQIYYVGNYLTSVARINFNNDSIDDLAILTCNQTVSIYLGTKLGIFHQSTISFHLDENNSSECVHTLRVADFNQDGKDDLVFINPGMQSVRVVLGTACDEHI